MNRVDTSTAVLSLPAQETPGDPGYFTKGNPGTGLPATVPGQDWFNAVQEELMAIIEGAGLTPDKADTDQVLEAINILSQAARYAADTGSANAYVAAYTPEITEHVVGLPLSFQAAHANTGASTFNPGPGAVAIKRQNGDALLEGDIPEDAIVTVIYDGTNYQLYSNNNASFYYADDTGAANAYAVAYSPALTAHVVGLPLSFQAAHANTGASTLAVNSLTAVAIKRQDGTALVAGDIPADGLMLVAYDGTNYQLLNPARHNGAVLIAANGYEISPNGLIRQWGKYTGALTDNQQITITLPLEFPTGLLNASGTLINAEAKDSVNQWIQVKTWSNSQITFVAEGANASGGEGFFWEVVGY
jgi:hypothetical protein